MKRRHQYKLNTRFLIRSQLCVIAKINPQLTKRWNRRLKEMNRAKDCAFCQKIPNCKTHRKLPWYAVTAEPAWPLIYVLVAHEWQLACRKRRWRPLRKISSIHWITAKSFCAGWRQASIEAKQSLPWENFSKQKVLFFTENVTKFSYHTLRGILFWSTEVFGSVYRSGIVSVVKTVQCWMKF